MEGVLVSVSRAMAELAAADRQRILELEAEVERLREALDGRGQQLAQAQMQRDEAWAEVERPTSDTTGKVGYVETTSKATFPTATADGGTVLVTSADVIGDGVSGPFGLEILRRLEDVARGGDERVNTHDLQVRMGAIALRILREADAKR
jgi:hypothetical protein